MKKAAVKDSPLSSHSTKTGRATIYPNPAFDHIFLTASSYYLHTFCKLKARNGVFLRTYRIEDSLFKIELSDMENGAYELHFEDGLCLDFIITP